MIQIRLASALKAAVLAIFATSAASGDQTIHWTYEMNDDIWGDKYLFQLGPGYVQDFGSAHTKGFVITVTATPPTSHLDFYEDGVHLHSSGEADDPLLFNTQPAPMYYGRIYREDGHQFSLLDIDADLGFLGFYYLRNDRGNRVDLVRGEEIDLGNQFLFSKEIRIYLQYEKYGVLDGRDWYGNQNSYGFDIASFTIADIPEPSSWLFLLMGFAGIAAARHRRGKALGAASAA